MPRKKAPSQLSDKDVLDRLIAFRQPPDGFNPLKATKRQLTSYGFPLPPDEKKQPKQARLWRAHMQGIERFVGIDLRDVEIDRSIVHLSGLTDDREFSKMPPPDHPFFVLDPRFADRPDLISDDFLLIKNLSPQTSNVWSGGYVVQPPTEPFNNAFGTFTVPTAQPPPSAWNGTSWNNGTYKASNWVGLDGWGNKDVMQAGVTSVATVSGGSVSESYYAWYEFFPTAEFPIASDTFPVTAGDVVSVLVCAPFNTTHAVANLKNNSNGSLYTVGFDAPGTTPGVSALQGSVAEWIVEWPGCKPTACGFANYGNVTFHDCIAGSKTQERDLRSGRPINMVDSAGKILSSGWLQSRSEVLCTYGK